MEEDVGFKVGSGSPELAPELAMERGKGVVADSGIEEGRGWLGIGVVMVAGIVDGSSMVSGPVVVSTGATGQGSVICVDPEGIEVCGG